MAAGGLPATRFVTVRLFTAAVGRKVKTQGLFMPDHEQIMHRPLCILLTAFLMSHDVLSADEITELHARAKGGDAKAQIDLAIRLRDGKGIAKNDAEAMQWAH